MRNFESPQINAGSMADIAFLLLIFFLVTTTLQEDLGILKMLPKENKSPITSHERNVMEVSINANNKILLNDIHEIELKDLRQALIDFIDNGTECDYCNGNKHVSSSDHPSKALIQLESSRGTSYGMYVSVQDELEAAYGELRNQLSMQSHDMPFISLETAFKKDKNNGVLKEKVKAIKAKYPKLIIETDAEKNLNN